MEDVVITDADFNSPGGGISNSGSLTVVNSLLSNNRGTQGGGIFNGGFIGCGPTGGVVTVMTSTPSMGNVLMKLT